MERNELFNMIDSIYRYFRYKEPPNRRAVDDWHTELKYIDANAVPFIMQQLRERDNLPRNLPKVIKGIYANYKRQNQIKKANYDPYDDPTFPIGYLYDALRILENKGKTEFMAFCRSVKMPAQDIERVQNKYNCIYDINELTQRVGINVNAESKDTRQTNSESQAEIFPQG